MVHGTVTAGQFSGDTFLQNATMVATQVLNCQLGKGTVSELDYQVPLASAT